MNKTKRVVTKNELIPCQPTYQGTGYSAVTHREVIETIGEYLYKKNLLVKKEIYLSASNGQRAIGRLTIDAGDKECGYEISWKNSLDGSMSYGLASGTHTFICSNGSVYGDISAYKRKHTGDAKNEIIAETEKAVNLMEETMNLHIERRDRMKELQISRRTIAELVGRLHLEEEIITANQLGIIKKELENPSFDYNSANTVWEFYNHCTHAIKESSPIFWHKKHLELGTFFVNEFGILTKSNQLELV